MESYSTAVVRELHSRLELFYKSTHYAINHTVSGRSDRLRADRRDHLSSRGGTSIDRSDRRRRFRHDKFAKISHLRTSYKIKLDPRVASKLSICPAKLKAASSLTP